MLSLPFKLNGRSLNEQYNVITMSDVKQAVKTSTKIKWQNRWTISGSGRQLYDLIPMVGNASHLDMPNPQIGSSQEMK
jgi:hypothetical protein